VTKNTTILSHFFSINKIKAHPKTYQMKKYRRKKAENAPLPKARSPFSNEKRRHTTSPK
jgi:hypothetical protein